MNKRQFVQQRKPSWRRFENLVDRSTSKLRDNEAAEFSRLFREIYSDLAVIRSRNWGKALETYLNHLVARGHNRFYSEPAGNLEKFIHFLSVGYPKLFRIRIGRIGQSLGPAESDQNGLELFGEIVEDLIYLLTSGPRVLTALVATGLIVYPIARLACGVVFFLLHRPAGVQGLLGSRASICARSRTEKTGRLRVCLVGHTPRADYSTRNTAGALPRFLPP